MLELNNLGESKVKLPHAVHKDVSKELRKAAEKVESLSSKKDPVEKLLRRSLQIYLRVLTQSMNLI